MPYFQIPSPAQPLVDPQTGRVHPVWFTYLQQLASAQNTGGNAPADSVYVLGNSDGDLPNARVLTDSASIDIDQGTPGQIAAHVKVDTSGALDGGTAADLAVRVDGVSVVINASNQLEAVATGTGDVVGPASSVDDRIATFDGVTGKLIQDGGKTIAEVEAAAVTAAEAAILPIDLASEVFGDLPLSNLTGASAASRLLGRGDSGAGDWQEITLGAGLAMTGTELDTSNTGAGYWTLLTDGDLTAPEFIFALGDCISVFVPA